MTSTSTSNRRLYLNVQRLRSILQPSDINAQLQDGVLTLAIHIGRLCDVQDLNEIPVH